MGVCLAVLVAIIMLLVGGKTEEEGINTEGMTETEIAQAEMFAEQTSYADDADVIALNTAEVAEDLVTFSSAPIAVGECVTAEGTSPEHTVANDRECAQFCAADHLYFASDVDTETKCFCIRSEADDLSACTADSIMEQEDLNRTF